MYCLKNSISIYTYGFVEVAWKLIEFFRMFMNFIFKNKSKVSDENEIFYLDLYWRINIFIYRILKISVRKIATIEYTLSLLYKQRSDLATGLGALGVACECCLISKT